MTPVLNIQPSKRRYSVGGSSVPARAVAAYSLGCVKRLISSRHRSFRLISLRIHRDDGDRHVNFITSLPAHGRTSPGAVCRARFAYIGLTRAYPGVAESRV